MNPWQHWTNNGTDLTIPFHWFFDGLHNDFVYPSGARFTAPFPLDFPPELETIIKEKFYYRQIAHEHPQRFLRSLWLICDTNVARWLKLLESENILTPEMGKYNYDLTETTTFQGEQSNTHTMTSQDTQTVNATNVMSDTPDNNISDIDNYMTTANKGSQTVDLDTSNTGTNAQTNTGGSTLTRKGNIGVMTAEQILSGYRKGVAWNAWEKIFADIEPCFMGVF